MVVSMSDFEPRRVVDVPGSTSRRDWERYTDGNWWLFRDCQDAWITDHAKTNAKIRNAAHKWAERHGYRVEGRAAAGGRQYHLRFTSIRREQS